MLLAYICALFVAIKLAEAYLPPYYARKTIHVLSGITLLLVPEPVSWTSLALIGSFSTLVVAREYLKFAKGPSTVYAALPSDEVSEASALTPGQKNKLAATEAEKVAANVVSLKRMDLGIFLFAAVAVLTPLLRVSYKWMIPLFFGDPAAAVMGRAVQSHPGPKTFAGGMAFAVASFFALVAYWLFEVEAIFDEGWACLLLVVVISIVGAITETVSGPLDNLALAVYGWLNAVAVNLNPSSALSKVVGLIAAAVCAVSASFFAGRFGPDLARYLERI